MDTTIPTASGDQVAGITGFFAPRSIAILGASGGTGLFSGPLRFLREQGYAGEVYPINPNHDSLHGLPCY
ncbi:CoA binding domain [Prauserella sp. Am3]|nr:CoA binding domain [Prauserella sp. Am3]